MVSALHNARWNCRAEYTDKAVLMLRSQVTWTAPSEQSSPQGGDASEVCVKSEPELKLILLNVKAVSQGLGQLQHCPEEVVGSSLGPGMLALQSGLYSRKDFPESNFPFKTNNCCKRAVSNSTGLASTVVPLFSNVIHEQWKHSKTADS